MSRRQLAARDGDRLPTFIGRGDQLDYLSTSSARGGVPLGLDPSRREVRAELLRPEPTRVALIGQPWLASLIAMRVALFGATIVVATNRPAPWQSIVTHSGGSTPLATIRSAQSETDQHLPLPVPNIDAPLLVIQDTGNTASDFFAPRAAWHTTLYLLSAVVPQVANLLDQADLVLIGKVNEEPARRLERMLRLPPSLAHSLVGLDPNSTLAVTRTDAQLLSVRPTSAESTVLTMMSSSRAPVPATARR